MTSRIDAREREDLDRIYGVVERGRRPRDYAPALRDLEKQPEAPGPSGACSTWSTAA